MKKIRSKKKALECSQHYKSIFSDAQGQINPELVMVSGQNLNSFKFHACLITCKNEDDSIKNEGARVVTKFFPL